MSELPAQSSSVNNKSGWLLTFADLLSLILTFFVLLYSMNSVQEEKWEEVSQSLSQRLNPDFIVRHQSTITEEKGIERINEKEATNLDYLEAIINDKILRNFPLNGVTIIRQDDRIILSLASDLFFVSGNADLQPEALPVIHHLTPLISYVNNRIETIGHTDPSPVKGAQYPSNWELSLHRAVTIAKALQDGGYSQAIRSFGLSNSRFDEITDEIPQPDRYRLARRVDIVIRSYINTD